MAKKVSWRLRITVAGLVVLAVLLGVLAGGGSGPSAKVHGAVVGVTALDGSTVRVYIRWTNTGKAAGDGSSCTVETTVMDRFGDQVGLEANSTSTNGLLAPGASRLLYQDLGVTSGDAAYIHPADITITGC